MSDGKPHLTESGRAATTEDTSLGDRPGSDCCWDTVLAFLDSIDGPWTAECLLWLALPLNIALTDIVLFICGIGVAACQMLRRHLELGGGLLQQHALCSVQAGGRAQAALWHDRQVEERHAQRRRHQRQAHL